MPQSRTTPSGNSLAGTSLTRQLNAFHAGFLQRLSPRDRALVEDSIRIRREDLKSHRIPQPGEFAPDFALPDQHGRVVRLSERLTHGPVVLLFVRGGWCPFCTLTLRGYQAALPAIHDAGADVLAIAPQRTDSCCSMAERDLLAFSTLSDQDNRISDAYGTTYDVEPGMRSFYLRQGHDLPRLNGTSNWRVPLPATFVIGRDGRVLLTHIDPQFHCRLEPALAVEALQSASVPA
jgi:peroxiredoxin